MSRHRLSINLGFALATLLTTWTGWYSYRESIQSRKSAQWVAHTYEVLGSLSLLISSLQEAETGQRAYIVSGKEEYLGPYYHSATRLAGQLGQLRSLTADHPVQRERVDLVSGMVARRLAGLNKGIASRRARGLDAVIAVDLAGEGKALMDSARSSVSGMQAIERSLLRERSATSGNLARRAELTIMLGIGLGLLLLATSALLANWEIRARVAAESGLRRANEELEDRVDVRTQELQSLNEELQIKIEERAGIEAELRAGKDFLRKVVDTNPQLVFIKDWDGRFVLANLPVAELYGTTVAALEGKSDADFNPNAAEVESFLRADQEVMQSGRRLDMAEEAVTDSRTGVTRWFQTVKVPLTTPDGRAKQVLGVCTEITERRHAEEQLRRTRDELQALFQAAPVAIVGIDTNGNVTHWSGRAETMFGWSAGEAIGQPLVNVPVDKQEEFRALKARALGGGWFAGLETQRIRKDGSPIDVSLSIAPLHDAAGRIMGIIGTYQDITERRLIAEQRRAREAADAANLAKSNFLANMSHELRTPLNAIIGFSELLDDRTFGELNERQQRYVTNVLSGGRHLLQLVNDILDLAKIEAGRLLLAPEPIGLGLLLQEMQRGLEPLAAAKHQTMTVVLQDNLPALTADRGKVKQILYNLLSNAIKFTRDGGLIEMHAGVTQAGDGTALIQVSVRDTGIGIAAEDLDRIFLEFEQLDSTYARQQQGTGLGLALTRRLVEAHGGRITVESTVGKGTSFTFVLPLLLTVPGGDDRQSPAVGMQERPQGPLVLVVEDDSTSRELLSHYLEEQGYSVAHAGTAAGAFESARQLRPAAITLDMLLPDDHGLELLARLRADSTTKDIPVVVVSILDEREPGLQAGAAAWLVKPVQRKQFIEALDALVPAGGNGCRVALVVDDDSEAMELATDVLRGRGFEVLQATGGREGLAMAVRSSPALIILDLNMPGVSGFTVAQQLRAHPRTRRTPILVSTAMDLTGSQRDELLRDVQTIVPKGGAQAILEALERLDLPPRRPPADGTLPSNVTAA